MQGLRTFSLATPSEEATADDSGQGVIQDVAEAPQGSGVKRRRLSVKGAERGLPWIPQFPLTAATVPDDVEGRRRVLDEVLPRQDLRLGSSGGGAAIFSHQGARAWGRGGQS